MSARPRRPGSLVGRLVGLAAAWSLAVLVIAGLSLSAFFNYAATNRFDDELSDTVDNLLAGTSVGSGQVTAPSFTDPRAFRVYSGEYWEIATDDGKHGLHAMARSRSLWDRVLDPPAGGSSALAAVAGQVVFYDSAGPVHQRLRVAAMEARLPDVASPLVFMAAEDRSPVDKDVRTFAADLAVALVLLGAGLIAAVFVQVRVGLRPLFALGREVAALRTGERERIIGDYPNELEPLSRELNALMAHTKTVVERQRTHVGNLAHALKTPLSVMLSETGQHPGELADVVKRQIEVMGQQVDRHLRRARAAARSQGQGERTPLVAAIDELVRTLERVFQNKGVVIDTVVADDLAFLGERQDLLEIVGNVLENACKWCVRRVRVSAHAVSPRALAIHIEDDGPGLAPEERQRVIQRGARLDEGAPGSGLGLSIVDELVRAYGGSMELTASPMGGLKVELVLPRAEA